MKLEYEYVDGDFTDTVELSTVHQAVITGEDELLVICSYGDYDDRKIFKLSGMSSGTITITEAPVNEDGLSENHENKVMLTNGLAVSQSGKIYYLRSNGFHDIDYIAEMDSFDDIEQSLFYMGSDYSDTANYLEYGIRLLTNLEGTMLFTADTYDYDPENPYGPWPDPSATDYDRIVRLDLSSTATSRGRLNYGTPGSGTSQFQNPIPLAVLPDNRLYIMDAGNNRLVSIDWKNDTPRGWQEYKPTGDESFEFSYFNYYNPCGLPMP